MLVAARGARRATDRGVGAAAAGWRCSLLSTQSQLDLVFERRDREAFESSTLSCLVRANIEIVCTRGFGFCTSEVRAHHIIYTTLHVAYTCSAQISATKLAFCTVIHAVKIPQWAIHARLCPHPCRTARAAPWPPPGPSRRAPCAAALASRSGSPARGRR